MTTIMLCGKPGRCCPQLVIKEDDGTIRELTKMDIKILKAKIKNGEL